MTDVLKAQYWRCPRGHEDAVISYRSPLSGTEIATCVYCLAEAFPAARVAADTDLPPQPTEAKP